MSRRTSSISDYEPDVEGQPMERRPRHRYADRGNEPVSYHNQQMTLPTCPQVHHPASPQVQPQVQPAQREFLCEVYPDIQTDIRQHNVLRHHKIATME